MKLISRYTHWVSSILDFPCVRKKEKITAGNVIATSNGLVAVSVLCFVRKIAL